MGSYTASEIAAWILRRTDRPGGSDVTPLKLQKLLYYAQAWSLALDDRPLFADEIEAWSHGPVVRKVYDEYVGYGWHVIDPPPRTAVRELDERSRARIERVLDVYGEISGTELERMAHAEEPWQEARRGLDPSESATIVISHQAMARYYRSIAGPAGRAP